MKRIKGEQTCKTLSPMPGPEKGSIHITTDQRVLILLLHSLIPRVGPTLTPSSPHIWVFCPPLPGHL